MQIGSLPPDSTSSPYGAVTRQAETQGQAPANGATQTQQTQQAQHTPPVDQDGDHDHSTASTDTTGRQLDVVT